MIANLTTKTKNTPTQTHYSKYTKIYC